MTQSFEPPPTDPRWRPAVDPAPRRLETPLARFLGGSPLMVLIRLACVSLIVGALLMWLDIRPMDVIEGVERAFRRLWSLGFDSIREALEYVLAGAVVVVPIWLAYRLLTMRGAR